MGSRAPWQDPPPVAPSTARKVLDVCRIDPDANNCSLRVLDFGCGKGRYMQLFARHIPASNVFGCEVDAKAVRYVRQLGFNCLLLDTSFSFLPFEDNSFHLVFSSNVIEHIPNPNYLCYLVDIYRVLRPGGVFAIGAPNYPIKRLYDIWTAIKTPEYRKYYLFDDPTHCNRLSIFQVERDLKRLFSNVYLKPSWLPLESIIPLLRSRGVRYRLRCLGYKFFGSCTKPRQNKTE